MRNALLICSALRTFTLLHAQTLPNFYWKLDQPGGTIAPDFMGQSDGMLQGNTSWQPTGGHFAGALGFHGNDARVDLGPCDITGGSGDQLTLACWFKTEIVSGTERILMAKTIGSNDDDFIWSLSLVNSTGARFRVNAGGSLHTVEIPPSSIFSGAWYQFTATYNGSGIRLYLNGSLSAYAAASGTLGFHPEAPATLGNLFDNSMPFYGSLDDVRIYEQGLSGAEVVGLVINDVMTGIRDAVLTYRHGSGLLLPAGTWREMRIIDASGREIISQNIVPGTPSVSLPNVTAGFYLVCLQGDDAALTSRVLVP